MAGKSRKRIAAELAAGREMREAVQVALGIADGKYYKAFDRRAHGYALLGHTNQEIAELLQIDPSTFDRWIVEHPSLAAALRKARVDDHVRVVRSLHRAANGFRHKETKLHVVGGKIKKTDVTKVYPPSVQAATVLLVNRMPGKWQDTKAAERGDRPDLLAAIREAMGGAAKVIEGSAEEAESGLDTPSIVSSAADHEGGEPQDT